tara:strand:- start:7594 stop:7809 length:216 start_codon:yes stop_codon:yes gene_type:complete
MTKGHRAVLHAHIPRKMAVERIESGDYGHYDPQEVYHLFMLAYENEDIANRAKLKFLEALVKGSCNDASHA